MVEPLEPEVCERCANSPCTCSKTPAEPCPKCGEQPCVCEKVTEPCPVCGEDPCVCEKKRRIKIKLADGKQRTIQHMMATSFWNPDGTPMSAAQFVERLFGDLPDLFKNEDELRRLWSKPDTRKRLMDGLEEKGYGVEQIDEIKQIISAEKSDVFDVLAYIAFALTPITREERVSASKAKIYNQYNRKEQQFLDFVLSQYIQEGVRELNQEKLPDLLGLKYHGVSDAAAELGSVAGIRDVFVGFQRYLYE